MPAASPSDPWLAARTTGAPGDLSARMRSAWAQVQGADARMSRSRRLLEAAATCIERALGAGSDRRAALDLLAADGLLTVACDAAAEEGDASAFALEASTRLAALLADRGA